MISDEPIIAGAKAIAVSLTSPAGRIKLARVVREHLDWFDLVTESGLTWYQISGLLASAGAYQENELPFSIGSISSAVWRARKATASSVNQKRSVESSALTPPTSGYDWVEKVETRSVGSLSNHDSKATKLPPTQPNEDSSRGFDRGELRRRMVQAVGVRR